MTTEKAGPETPEAIMDVAAEDLVAGEELLEAAGDAARETVAEAVVATADLVHGADDLAAAETIDALADVAAADAIRDEIRGAATLDASGDVAAVGALLAAVGADDLDRGMVMASVSGQLRVAGEVADLMGMPVFAAFLATKGRQLHGLAVNEIGRAMGAAALAKGMDEISDRLAVLGLDEMIEGARELETADALLDARDDAVDAGTELTAAGVAEMAAAAGKGKAARQLAGAGVVMVAQGAEEAGVAEGVAATAVKPRKRTRKSTKK